MIAVDFCSFLFLYSPVIENKNDFTVYAVEKLAKYFAWDEIYKEGMLSLFSELIQAKPKVANKFVLSLVLLLYLIESYEWHIADNLILLTIVWKVF